MLLSGLLACSSTQVMPAGEDDANAPTSGSGATQGGVAGAAGASQGAGAGGSVGAAGAAGAAGVAGSAGAAGSTGAGGGATTASDSELFALAQQCGVIDLAALHAPCPEAAKAGSGPCSLEEQPRECSYVLFARDDPEQARGPTHACQARCVVLESRPFWSGSCTECARACVLPAPESVVHELDTIDCLQRPLTPCVVGLETTQVSLDATLTGLLPQASGAYSELHNTFLQIELHDGCVSRFYVPSGSDPLTRVLAVLGPALADKRFECAQDLSCGQIQGPDTLATP